MAEALFNMINNDCTDEEVLSLLDSRPHIRSKINEQCVYFSSFTYAIVHRISLDIIQELLRAGGNPNHELEKCGNALEIAISLIDEEEVEDPEYFIELFKLLFKYEADINQLNRLKSTHFYSCLQQFTDSGLDIEAWKPLFQLIYQKANESTKTNAFQMIVEDAIAYRSSNKTLLAGKLKTFAKLIKWMLQLGMCPTCESLSNLLHYSMKCVSCDYTRRNFLLVMDLFEIITLHIQTKLFGKDDEFMALDHADYMMRIEESNYIPSYKSEILFESVKELWNTCFVECQEMAVDYLPNKCSMLQKMCEIRHGTSSVSSEIAYEMLLRMGLKKYPHFTEIMRVGVINSDMIGVYDLLKKKHSDNDSVPETLLFSLISQFLLQKDIFNCLLALAPLC